MNLPSVQGNVNAGADAAVRVQPRGGANNPGVNAGGNAAVRTGIDADRNRGNNPQFNRPNDGRPGDGRFSNDPRFNDPRFRNDPRFNNNNNNRTFADRDDRPTLNPRHYDPSFNQFRLNNRTVNYANPNYRPSYSRYNWYNGFAAGPYSGLYGANAANRYGVGYRGGFGNNVGNTLLGLGLSALSGGGYGYGLGGAGGLGGGYGLGYPAGWGLGGWGLGSMAYTSGLLPYSNPYFNGGGANYAYNYAQPIPVALAGQPNVNETAEQKFDTAREQFRNGDFSAALASVDAAIKLQPTDAVMHEFRALTQFALGDYRNSAATIHSVLAVGPGWDWATMIGLYPNVDTYTTQLRALEQVVTQNPKQADTRFLLGYQYMTAGHATDASKQFQLAADIMPSDNLAAELSRLNNPDQSVAQVAQAPDDNSAPTQPANQTAAAQAAPEIDPQKLVGDWKAERADGSKFDVDFSPDNTFVWKYTKGDKTQTLNGTYGVENDMLVLQSKEGGAMLGHVTLKADDAFNFKLLGTPSADQGLAFNR